VVLVAAHTVCVAATAAEAMERRGMVLLAVLLLALEQLSVVVVPILVLVLLVASPSSIMVREVL
jgi:hypothetical protein